MPVGYQVAYRLGLTPWEQAGEGGKEQLAGLLDQEAQSRPTLGRALDLGCGTGAHTIELARRGWQATGVDSVAKALAQARKRPEAAQACFVKGDVTHLDGSDLRGDVEFFLDIGCFHGLNDDQRLSTARGVTALATPSATMLLLAFRPGARRPLPRGADQSDIERAFANWKVLAVVPADTSGLPGPLKKATPSWFRLQRVR